MTLIRKKACNALIEDARVNLPTQLFLRRVGGNTILNVGRKLTGGLWVGGNIYLYDDLLMFRPNFINKLLHKGDTSWRIPIKEVQSAQASFGVITRIITIQTQNGTFRIRCYNADRFAEEITQHIVTSK